MRAALLALPLLAAAAPARAEATCPAAIQALRSAELARMADEDQADRQGTIDWDRVSPRDHARLARVTEIAAENCLSTAEDYSNAAIVAQHGDATDDYWRAYQWWTKSVALGKTDDKRMVARAADRWLVSLGYKQLFASQASAPSLSPDACDCLEPVAAAMDEAVRTDYMRRGLKESFAWVDSLNAGKPGCGPAAYCAHALREPPKGLLPGLW